MARPKLTPEMVARVEALFDFVAGTDGKTITEIATELELAGPRQARKVVSATREFFQNDEQNLVCNPQGEGERWLYSFASGREDTRFWGAWQLMHVESQFESLENVLRSCLLGTDPKSPERKAVKRVLDTVIFVRGQLADLAV